MTKITHLDIPQRSKVPPTLAEIKSFTNAAWDGDTNKLATFLLVHGKESVDLTDTDGHTALCYAANCGQEECASLLLEAGAATEKMDTHNFTPLLYAAEHKHENIVDMLLSRKADVHARASDGSTPLSLAAMAESKSIVEKLLAAGAHVDTQDAVGNTVLMTLVILKKDDMAAFLLGKGADPAIANKRGKMPIDKASPAMAALLRKVEEKRAQDFSRQIRRAATHIPAGAQPQTTLRLRKAGPSAPR